MNVIIGTANIAYVDDLNTRTTVYFKGSNLSSNFEL